MSEPTVAEKTPRTREEIELGLEVSRHQQEKAQFQHEKELSLPSQTYFKGISANDPLNKMMAFCEGILGARFVQEEIRNDLPSIFFVVNVGNDLGLKWTHSLRQLYMTPKGKLGMEGGIMLALLHSHHFKVKLLRSDAQGAEYWIKRPGGEEEFEWSSLVTWELAKEQGWPFTSKNDLKPPWRDPANMLRWRSLAVVARVVAADLLGGIYLPDELEGIDMAADSQGTYTSKREQAEAAADKQAEEDPKYEIKRKMIETVAAGGLHKNHGHETFSEFRNANGLSPSEARNEQFLKQQAQVPLNDAPFDLEPVSAPSQAETLMEDVAARIRSMSENLQIPITPLSEFVVGYLGDTQVGPENVSKVLNDLTRIWEDHPKEVLAELVENAGRMGEEVRKAHNEHLPWVPKKQKTTKPKGVQQSL